MRNLTTTSHCLPPRTTASSHVDFKPVKGSDSCYEFSAAALGVGAAEGLRAGDSEAVIWSRQCPCRCLPCRHKRLGSGDDKDDDCWNLHFFAPAKKHDTSHNKKTWTVEETAQKKKDAKQKRKEKAAEKAAAILKGAGSAEWRVAAELQEAAAAEAEDAEDEEAAAEEAEADDMNDE